MGVVESWARDIDSTQVEAFWGVGVGEEEGGERHAHKGKKYKRKGKKIK